MSEGHVAPPETKGVEVQLHAVDLAGEIDGMQGRRLPMGLENRGTVPAVEISVDIVSQT